MCLFIDSAVASSAHFHRLRKAVSIPICVDKVKNEYKLLPGTQVTHLKCTEQVTKVKGTFTMCTECIFRIVLSEKLVYTHNVKTICYVRTINVI